MKSYEIQEFDILSASKEEWARYHSCYRQRRSEKLPGDPIESDESHEEWTKASLSEIYSKWYTVSSKKNPKEIVAFLKLNTLKETSASYEGNKNNLMINLEVLNDHKRKGIGRELLKLVHKHAVDSGKSMIIGGSMEEDGRELNRILGGTEALEMRNYRLDLNDVDWNMIEQWEKEGVERSPDASLEFHTVIPDEIIEDYTKKYTEVFNQAPFDDLAIGDQIYTPELFRKYDEVFEKTGQTWLTALIQEKNGDISGLSDVFYVPEEAPKLGQGLTGVDQKYRGHGKGKWVKAAMLLKIREKFPDIKVISTGNATSNAPMIHINERMGFKLHHETYNMQIETDKLGEYLKNR